MSSVEKHAAMRAEGWQFSTAENEFVGTVGARFFYAYTIATVLQHLKCMYVSIYMCVGMRLRRYFPSHIVSDGTIEAYLPAKFNDSVPLWHVRLAQ